MKSKRLFSFNLFCLFGVGLFPAFAQNAIVIRFLDGREKNETISSLTKMTFSGTDLKLNYANGGSEAIGLSSIRKLNFQLTDKVRATRADSTGLSFFPNPVSDCMTIVNLPDGFFVATICRLNGQVVLQARLSPDLQQIDVGGLQQGLYFLKINGQTLKFCKQ